MPTCSRDMWRVVLSPYQWVTLCQVEDPYNDPAYFYHGLSGHLFADLFNTASVRVDVHDSEDGIHWVALRSVSTSLVPGGEISFSVSHTRRWVRVVLYSQGSGVVRATKIVPELHVLPHEVTSLVEGEVSFPEAEEVEVAEPVVTVETIDPPIQCKFSYTFAAWLDWEPEEQCYDWNWPTTIIGDGNGGPWEWCTTCYADMNLYVRDGTAGEVVYFDNPAGTDLTLNHDAYPHGASNPTPPEVITGAYTEANEFYVWYNQLWTKVCFEEVEPTLKQITIVNTGTCRISVNGEVLLAGESYVLEDFDYAGYGTGDMHAWLGGTPVAV